MGPLKVLSVLLLFASPSALRAQDSSGPARSPDVVFVPTNMEVVKAMLTTAKVGKGDVVYDLGCGDGRIPITAIKKYGASSGVCVDIDPVRIKESRRNADTAGVAGKMKFVNADLFQQDLSPASVVTLYLLPLLNVRLRPKLFRELKPGTRVVSNSFDMGDWKADSTMSVKQDGGFSSFAYYWVIPADVAGTWKVSGAPGGGYTIRLEQQYQQVKGTAEGNGGRPIPLDSAWVKGDSVGFTLRDGGSQLKFSGTANEEKMSGVASGGARKAGAWTATRVQRGPRPELADSASGTD
jgi:SAM-dependent methyltransferase